MTGFLWGIYELPTSVVCHVSVCDSLVWCEKGVGMTREETLNYLSAMVTVSGLDHDKIWEIPNKYWPDSYTERFLNSPWILVRTPKGMVTIGQRKRVLSISWEDTKLRKVITEDDVTKSETLVHAWSQEDAVKYLRKLNEALKDTP